jgi:hypothetical protein
VLLHIRFAQSASFAFFKHKTIVASHAKHPMTQLFPEVAAIQPIPLGAADRFIISNEITVPVRQSVSTDCCPTQSDAKSKDPRWFGSTTT